MKLRRGLQALMLVPLLVSGAHATERQPTLTADGKPLRMDKLDVKVDVLGNLATTAMTMTFRNDTNRVLQGELVFPLQEGQKVSGYALDINGKMRDAVVIEKDKGRKVFEAIVRRGVDPGLLEKTAGNNYRTRVYPIPARGTRTVRITYESELATSSKGQAYTLPIEFKSRLSAFDVKVVVHQEQQAPQVADGFMTFDQAGNNYVATMSRENYLADSTLKFWLPRSAAASKAIRYEDNGDGFHYYMARIPAPSVRTKTADAFSAVTLYWDVSGSAAKNNHAKVYAFLNKLLQQPRFPKQVELITFSNTQHSKEMVDISSSVKPLIGYLKSLDYDGGTQLGSIDLSSAAKDTLTILVTDGVATFGKAEPQLGQQRTLVINSQLTAEHARLRRIAQETNGWYANLSKLSTAQALSLVSASPVKIDVTIDGKRSADVIAHQADGYTKIIARSTKVVGKMVVQVNNGPAQTVTLPSTKQASNSEQLARHWAQRKIDMLEMEAERNRSRIVAIGKDYGVVSRFTSMIVLERISDYVENDIEPPVELMAEYQRLRQQRKQQQAQTTDNHLQKIATLYQREIDWWNKEFERPRKQRSLGGKKQARGVNQTAANFGADAERDRAPGAPVDQPAMRPAPSPVVAQTTSSVPPPRQEMARESLEEEPEAEEVSDEAGEVMSDAEVAGGLRTGKAKEDKRRLQAKTKVKLAKWNPKTPYLDKLRSTDKELAYATYLSLKKDYANSSAFFLDVADYFNEQGQKAIALRVLSNVAEMKLENHQLLRILAYRLQQLGHLELAIHTFKVVKTLRPEQPQSWRDLGLAYDKAGRQQLAVDMLWQVVSQQWNNRFPEIQVIALYELNRVLDRNPKLDSSFIPANLRQKMRKGLPVDLRVVLSWDADVTDIDLWVTDPFGEKCYYNHANTRAGGRMSRDITGGYGPEVFLMKKAFSGNYKVQANYYGNRQQTLAGATTIQLEFISNWGKADETRKAVTMRLKNKKETVLVGEFTVE